MDYAISDTHVNHKNILDFCKETRPFKNTEEMHDTFIKDWNKRITNDDTVWHLGDFIFGSDFSILDKLNGKINLIKGNHDEKLIKHRADRFENIFDIKEIKINKITYILCHYRLMTWNKSHWGSKHLFGHSHNGIQSIKNAIDVGYDNPLFKNKPMTFSEIEEVSNTLPETFDNKFNGKEFV